MHVQLLRNKDQRKIRGDILTKMKNSLKECNIKINESKTKILAIELKHNN